MSTKTHVPVTTIQGWKKRGMIPGARRDEILLAARENGIDLSDLLEGVAPPANENADEAVSESAPIRIEEDLPPSVRAWHGMRSRRRTGDSAHPSRRAKGADDEAGDDEDEDEGVKGGSDFKESSDFSDFFEKAPGEPEDDLEDDSRELARLSRDSEAKLSDDDDDDDDFPGESDVRVFSQNKGEKKEDDDEDEDDLSFALSDLEDGTKDRPESARHAKEGGAKEGRGGKSSSSPDLVSYRRGAGAEWTAPQSVMQDKPYGEGELSDLMDRIKTVEVQGGRHMTLIAGALVAAALAFTMVVFWPSAPPVVEGVSAPVSQVAQVQDPEQESSVSPEERSSFLKDIKGVLDKAGEESAALKDKIETTVAQAQGAVETLADPTKGTLPDRLRSAADQIDLPTGISATLGDFSSRLESMARDLQGQQTLQTALARLRTLAGVQSAQPGLEARALTVASLDAARSQDPALAQTFAGVPAEDLKAASLLLAFTQVRDSFERGNTPFNKDLELLLNLVGEDDPALRESLLRLAPQAEKGILTPAGLTRQFKSMAGEAVVASLQGEDVSFEDRAKARLNQVLQVEKNGELVTGTDTQAKIARAQAALDAGDVEGAVTELEGLDGAAAQTARPWIDEAQAVVTAGQIKQMFAGLVSGGLPIGTGGGIKYTARSKGFSGLLPQPVIRDPASGVVVRPNGLQLPKDGPLPDVPSASPAR